MPERRNAHRARTHIGAWCDGPGGTFFCAVHDASESGMFLHVGAEVPLGTVLKITLDEVPSGPVVAEGEVVWRRAATPTLPPGVGMRLVHFHQGWESWARYLRLRRRSPSSPGLTATPDRGY